MMSRSVISGTTKLAAVIGSPVGHSLSPALQNAAFDAAGLDWRFVAFDVDVGGGASAVTAMRSLGIVGFAVTMPLKVEVSEAVDEVDSRVAALRSVNTVVLRDDGTTYGTSTDGAGFVASLHASHVEVSGISVGVIGAGAAARSIIHALGRAGAADIVVVNRTAANAHTACELAPCARVGDAGELYSADLIVNTTSVGMGTAASDAISSAAVPLDASKLRSATVVADIVYHPLDTPLLVAARSVGCRIVDGLGMLVHQAALQHELWTGHRPDPAVMRSAAEAELSAQR